MKPRRQIYMYLSALAGVTELFAAHHRVRHRLTPRPSSGGMQVGTPGGFGSGWADV